MSARKKVLIVGSGAAEVYRRYSLEAIAKVYDVVLLDDVEPTWQQPFIVGAIIAPLNLKLAYDPLDDALRAHPVDGVLSWDERRLELVAEIAARYGLRTVGLESVRACRDKWRTREILAAAGVPSAHSRLTQTTEAAASAAAEIGFPVVVKPRGLAGSIGVQRVDDVEELAEAWVLANGATMPSVTPRDGVLVEEFLTGDEYSVECVTIEGATTVVAVTRKRVGLPPYFEEIGHIVNAADRNEALFGEIADVAARALDAVGFTDGVTHVEVKVGPAGPRIIEINARLGGDLIPHLVALATGYDLSVAAASIAVGDPPTSTEAAPRAAGIHFFYPPFAGVFTNHELGAWASEPWVDRCVWVKPHGTPMGLPPEAFMGRLGFVVVMGDDAAEVRARLRVVESETVISMSQRATA